MIYDTLSSIAPTLLFNPYPPPNGPNQLDEMQQTFLAIADAVNRRDPGETVLQNMRKTFKTAEQQLRLNDLSDSSFIEKLGVKTSPLVGDTILSFVGKNTAIFVAWYTKKSQQSVRFVR